MTKRFLSLLFTGIMSTQFMNAANAQRFPAVKELPKMEELPAALSMRDGTPVTSAEQWRDGRRPEIVNLVQHYMYGFAPASYSVEVENDAPEAKVLGGKARLKQVALRLIEPADSGITIHLALFVPNTPGPHPVFLGMNKEGNHETVNDEAVLMSDPVYKDDPVPRGARADFWCVAKLIERGYAFATFRESDVDPDDPDLTNGIHAAYRDMPEAPENRWGTIRAWAWGYHRCVDYLSRDNDIDAKKIAVIGHSRRGKTALLAAALDERIALCVPHQSGTGGCALSRGNDQETVERINRVFPHWFNDAFTQFNNNEEQLPFDQHLLLALVAPRALLDTEGAQDHWANPNSALRAVKAAAPVWELLGTPVDESKLLATSVDSVGGSPIQQLRLDFKHTLNADYWEGILKFADSRFR